MKITRKQLKKIVNEEVDTLRHNQAVVEDVSKAIIRILKRMKADDAPQMLRVDFQNIENWAKKGSKHILD